MASSAVLRLVDVIETQIATDYEFCTVSYGPRREKRQDPNRAVRTEKTSWSTVFLSGSEKYFKSSDWRLYDECLMHVDARGQEFRCNMG